MGLRTMFQTKAMGVAAGFAAGYGEAGHLGAVALHVFEVGGEGGVGVVDEVAVEAAFGAGVAGGAVWGLGFVDHAGRALRREEAELACGRGR